MDCESDWSGGNYDNNYEVAGADCYACAIDHDLIYFYRHS
jgi:hypothetical protein